MHWRFSQAHQDVAGWSFSCPIWSDRLDTDQLQTLACCRECARFPNIHLEYGGRTSVGSTYYVVRSN